MCISFFSAVQPRWCQLLQRHQSPQQQRHGDQPVGAAAGVSGRTGPQPQSAVARRQDGEWMPLGLGGPRLDKFLNLLSAGVVTGANNCHIELFSQRGGAAQEECSSHFYHSASKPDKGTFCFYWLNATQRGAGRRHIMPTFDLYFCICSTFI